jgi:dihydroflavonol-4-reductase
MRPWLLLTGASGFLGRHLVLAAQARGYGVLGLVRQLERAPFAPGPQLELIVGDLLDPPSLEQAARRLRQLDADGVVLHSAALISYRTRDRERCAEVNRSGTSNLLAALTESGLKRLLLVSSVVALGPASGPTAAVDEDGAYRGAHLRAAYVHSKRAAQEAALGWGAAAGHDCRAILPGAIFGPGTHSNTARFLARVRQRGAPRWVPPGSLSPIALGDVVEGAFLALERGQPGRTYLLVEGAYSLLEVFTAAAEACGTRAPQGTIPARLWPLITAGARGIDRLWPLGLLAPDALELLGQHFAYDGGRARRELGFAPRPLPAILAAALEPEP